MPWLYAKKIISLCSITATRETCKTVSFFREVIVKIKDRLESLGLNQDTHTLVFDRGTNSKKNLDIVKTLGFCYVGALTPYHHEEIIDRATQSRAPAKKE